MTLYRIPPEAGQETEPFLVAGYDPDTGELLDDLTCTPDGCFYLPEGTVLFSTQICGGNLEACLRDAKAAYGKNLWLLLEPMRHVFPLPCPDGNGQKISEAESSQLQTAHQVYDAPDFLCRYCTYSEKSCLFVHLFDTDETIAQKLLLAKCLNIDNIIYIM